MVDASSNSPKNSRLPTDRPITRPAAVLGKPRPLTQVILLSGATGLLYYGYYKWMIQDELKAHGEKVWSGALCILPFILGIAIPLALAKFDPDVPSEFGYLAFSGVVWIYIVQLRLYQEINRLYTVQGWQPPLVSWWIVVPGLNLIVGLRQIHFLSEYWAKLSGHPAPDPVAERLPFLSRND